MLIKFYNVGEWLYKTESKDRDEIGLAIVHSKTKFQVFFISIFCGAAVAGGTLMGLPPAKDYGGRPYRRLVVFSTVTAFFLGMAMGVLLTWYQNLPMTPFFYLTRLREGYYIRYIHRNKCPCMTHCTFCQPMHSHDGILVLFVEDELRLLQILKGEDPDKEG